ncbi:mesothelin [Paroedura picta]|uniref:mesothelin n=1 Tax=Paroedura picta TaxID=143630 RepID=UPI0040562933
MGRSPFGIMFQSSKILSCLLLIGWAASATAESEEPVQSVSTSRLKGFVKSLQFPRHRRASGVPCPPGKEVTDEVAQDDMMPMDYEPEELDACLGDDTLLKYLHVFPTYPFTDEQLSVIKKKLDKMYPDGYPESVLRDLGDFMSLMGPEDAKKWNVSSPETLASLLASNPAPALAAAIIRQYTDSGGPLNATALNLISPAYICLLEPDQLEKIHENDLRDAAPLNLSRCNQTTKDILYPKAKRAFSDRHNPPHYYRLIWPYLGGAPGEDLRALSKDNVNMDIDTFMELRKDAIMTLAPKEIANLMGKNLQQLKDQENNPLVKDWISRQKQSELDELDIGLTGGTPEGYINLMPRNNN